MSKYILASGCSYTNPNYISQHHKDLDCSWPKWPKIVANNLGLEDINVAVNGCDHKHIVDSLLPHIVSHPEDIAAVMVGWTETWRQSFYHDAAINMLADLTEIGKSYRAERKRDKFDQSTFSIMHLFNDWGWKDKILSLEFCKHVYGDYLKNVIILQNVCKLYDIPLIMGNLLQFDVGAMYRTMVADELGRESEEARPYMLQIHEASMNAWFDNDFFKDVDPKGWIGFPLFKDAGGFTIYDEIEDRSWAEGREKYKISLKDTHPNAYGHECIAEYYLKEYKSVVK